MSTETIFFLQDEQIKQSILDDLYVMNLLGRLATRVRKGRKSSSEYQTAAKSLRVDDAFNHLCNQTPLYALREGLTTNRSSRYSDLRKVLDRAFSRDSVTLRLTAKETDAIHLLSISAATKLARATGERNEDVYDKVFLTKELLALAHTADIAVSTALQPRQILDQLLPNREVYDALAEEGMSIYLWLAEALKPEIRRTLAQQFGCDERGVIRRLVEDTLLESSPVRPRQRGRSSHDRDVLDSFATDEIRHHLRFIEEQLASLLIQWLRDACLSAAHLRRPAEICAAADLQLLHDALAAINSLIPSGMPLAVLEASGRAQCHLMRAQKQLCTQGSLQIERGSDRVIGRFLTGLFRGGDEPQYQLLIKVVTTDTPHHEEKIMGIHGLDEQDLSHLIQHFPLHVEDLVMPEAPLEDRILQTPLPSFPSYAGALEAVQKVRTLFALGLELLNPEAIRDQGCSLVDSLAALPSTSLLAEGDEVFKAPDSLQILIDDVVRARSAQGEDVEVLDFRDF